MLPSHTALRRLDKSQVDSSIVFPTMFLENCRWHMSHSSPNITTNLVKLGQCIVYLCVIENAREKEGHNMLSTMSDCDAGVFCSKDETSILYIFGTVKIY